MAAINNSLHAQADDAKKRVKPEPGSAGASSVPKDLKSEMGAVMQKFLDTPDEMLRQEMQELLDTIDREWPAMMEQFEKRCPGEYAKFIAETQSKN